MCPLVSYSPLHAYVQGVGESDIRIASTYA